MRCICQGIRFFHLYIGHCEYSTFSPPLCALIYLSSFHTLFFSSAFPTSHLCIPTFATLALLIILGLLPLHFTFLFLSFSAFPYILPPFLDRCNALQFLCSPLMSTHCTCFHVILSNCHLRPVSSCCTLCDFNSEPSIMSSRQSPGVAGPPLPRPAPAWPCQLAAGPLPALHLHHCLLQHLERSQDVWKGN